jgi:hypothetical protein
MGRVYGTYVGKRSVYKVMERKFEGKRPLGRHRHRWKDNIEMHLEEMGWEGVDWIDLAEDRDKEGAHTDTGMNLSTK